MVTLLEERDIFYLQAATSSAKVRSIFIAL